MDDPLVRQAATVLASSDEQVRSKELPGDWIAAGSAASRLRSALADPTPPAPPIELDVGSELATALAAEGLAGAGVTARLENVLGIPLPELVLTTGTAAADQVELRIHGRRIAVGCFPPGQTCVPMAV